MVRRALTIPVVFAAALSWAALFPVSAVVFVAFDAVRRDFRFPAVRFLVFLGTFLWLEVLGLVAALTIPPRSLERNFRLQCWWTRSVFHSARVLFSVRVETEGLDVAPRRPVLVLVRHVSLADALLPSVFLSTPHGLLLRYVLKRELLWDPCMDVMGHRLPNCFVDRASSQSEAQLAAISALTREMGEDQGVLIFPEGTRFSSERRDRARARAEAQGDVERVAQLDRLEHVLPPHPGGFLTALGARPDLDVLVIAHTGFEGVRRFTDLMNGALIGRTIRIRAQRFAASELPKEEPDRVAWLNQRWLDVDAFVRARPPHAEDGP